MKVSSLFIVACVLAMASSSSAVDATNCKKLFGRNCIFEAETNQCVCPDTDPPSTAVPSVSPSVRSSSPKPVSPSSGAPPTTSPTRPLQAAVAIVVAYATTRATNAAVLALHHCSLVLG
ncbi:hypothetical protein LEN26_008933 [Aphanomyces euteiches]|nr:hypothetical protein LEN26_008933 [Aphanomyces euteiches]